MHPQPLIRKDGQLWTVPDHDITSVAWTWLDPLHPVDATRLESIYSAPMDFTYGAPAFFKPCVSEVLDQAPSNIVTSAYGFEVTGAAVNGDHHTATVTFYRIRG